MTQLLIDNDAQCSLEDFIEANTGADVFPVPDEYIDKLKKLDVGESLQLPIGGGWTEIRRMPV